MVKESATDLVRPKRANMNASSGMPKGASSVPAIIGAGSEEVAQYIADMLLELRGMARGADLPHLVYFLEMAFQEAFNQSSKGK